MRWHRGLVITIGVVAGLLCHSLSYADGFSFRKPSPLYNKGEIYTRTVTGDVAIGVGADGTILSADSSTATGLRWVVPSTGGGAGDVTASGTLTSNAVMIGQGAKVIAAITTDTATSGHFLASTATSPAFRQIQLTDVGSITADTTAGHAFFSTTSTPAFRSIQTPDVAFGVFGSNFGGTGQTTVAKGDLLVGNPAGTGWQKLTVGANGTILSADSAQTLGVSWVTPAAAGGSGTITSSTAGKMAFYTASTTINGASTISTDTTVGTRLSVGIGTSTATMDVGGSFRMVVIETTDGANVQFDANRGNMHFVRLAGQPRTLLKPVNGLYGQIITAVISQDNTGSRKIGFGTGIKFGTDIATFDATTTAGSRDYIKMACMTLNCVTWDVVGISKGYR